mmetsp:Transcript_33428/g.78845  ORF Transcript_33428/g.78845 Transcript_33428/m.78845 type:complete len:95 (+) Transcript_33428:187-471(+)
MRTPKKCPITLAIPSTKSMMLDRFGSNPIYAVDRHPTILPAEILSVVECLLLLLSHDSSTRSPVVNFVVAFHLRSFSIENGRKSMTIIGREQYR